MLDTNISARHPHTVPATTDFDMLSETTSTKISSIDAWRKSYLNNTDCSQIIEFLKNPDTITNKSIQLFHHKYRQPLRKSSIISENDLLFLKEHINNNKYVNLYRTERSLKNFIPSLPFESNWWSLFILLHLSSVTFMIFLARNVCIHQKNVKIMRRMWFV